MKMTPEQQKASETSREQILDAVNHTRAGNPDMALNLGGRGLMELPQGSLSHDRCGAMKTRWGEAPAEPTKN